jgi:4-diphosphocytidyl-2-C-methyl-D-erythritol kinase
MVVFPNAKINIGLNIIKRRSDGYHDLETVFYPIALSDILEVIVRPVNKDVPGFSNSGLRIDAPQDKNLCIKALNLLKRDFQIPEVCIHLHKIIPFGAGLGGGSSDASFMLILLNNLFSLGIDDQKLAEYASKLGSDTVFFTRNKPVLAKGRGELLEEVKINLKGFHIAIIKPQFNISTAEAYSGIKPKTPEYNLAEIIQQSPEKWKGVIKNDFEEHLFERYPQLPKIKDTLYQCGALYASMSGSGSSVYGIFNDAPDLKAKFAECLVWTGILE